MTRVVRALNDEGIAIFRGWLLQPATEPPLAILDDPRFSEEIAHEYSIDGARRFDTTFDLGRYLHDEVIGPGADRIEIRALTGMWTWISLVMIHNLLGRTRKKKGLPLDPAHYIDAGARLGYRLICRTAWELVWLHGDSARVAISSRQSPWGDVAEQMTSRQEIYMHPSFWAVSNRLYLSNSGDIKPGTTTQRSRDDRRNPKSRSGLGGLRRLAMSFRQFERTYLVREMAVDQLMEILPPEYGRWKQP